MFKFIIVTFLTAQAALVLGIMTKGDLPVEIHNCLDNVLVPGVRLRAYCRKLNDENAECRRNELVRTGDEMNCLNKIRELKPTDRKFAGAYSNSEDIKAMEYDFSSEIPKNARDCVDSMKPMLQADFKSRRDCEAFMRTDDSENPIDNAVTPNPYQACLDRIGGLYEHPQMLKCNEIADTLSNKQSWFLESYVYKVVFDF